MRRQEATRGAAMGERGGPARRARVRVAPSSTGGAGRPALARAEGVVADVEFFEPCGARGRMRKVSCVDADAEHGFGGLFGT